jgi:phosphoribosylformylglycinamidine synthase
MRNPGDYGLSAAEYREICSGLGREPNHTEMGIYSAMWSEHCSYKHTRALFAQFPTQADWVLHGPGENAGVVSIGAGWAVVFKVESHNHPSYVAPYDGAATGVGGLLRDVMAMGARPVAVKPLLRSSAATRASATRRSTQEMIAEIRRGAGEYARACGVAELGMDWASHPSFETNPLVNVLVLGLARESDLMISSAGQPGNVLLYYGRPTGSDGVAGAVFASQGMDETTEAHPPAGDARAGAELLEATLQLIERGLIAGLQDMGAAGLTCSSFEMAAKAGCGLRMDLSQVPQDTPGISAYELLLSERQERMLAAVQPALLDQARELLQEYAGLQHAVIGQATDGGLGEVVFDGETAASLPVQLVTDGFLRLPLSSEQSPLRAADAPQVEEDRHAMVEVGAPYARAHASQIRVERMTETPGPCEQIRLPWIGKTILLRTLANGADIQSDPYGSVYRCVQTAYSDIVAAGGRPLGLTDGLNFGNPDDAAVAWQIGEAVRGIADACRALNVAVVGGNVSLYNETAGAPILGQVFIGMVGVREDAQ